MFDFDCIGRRAIFENLREPRAPGPHVLRLDNFYKNSQQVEHGFNRIDDVLPRGRREHAGDAGLVGAESASLKLTLNLGAVAATPSTWPQERLARAAS